MNEPNENDPQITKAMRRLEREIGDGLRHGFFELSVVCEMVRDRKRKLTIKAGKTYRFTIPEDEVPD